MYLHCRFCRYLSMCLCMYDVLPNSEDDVVTAAWAVKMIPQYVES